MLLLNHKGVFVRIIIVPANNKDDLRKHFDEYLTKLHEFVPNIQFDNGKPVYRWFDYYWTEKNRIPFALMIENKFAGFCLMREIDNTKIEIAEFYVCPEFRKDGNALWFASEIIKMFEVDIELSTSITNLRAINFWTKVVNQYPRTETYQDEKWKYWSIINTHKIEW